MNADLSPTPELRRFCEALCDPQRLRLAGQLAGAPQDAAALGRALALPEAALRRHLEVLMRAGLVQAERERYRLNLPQLRRLARQLHAPEGAPNSAVERSIRPFLDPAGRVRALPVQRKKLLALLRHVAGRFEPGRLYREREVNALLGEVSADPFALRRLLIDHGELARERDGSAYWRAASTPEAP